MTTLGTLSVVLDAVTAKFTKGLEGATSALKAHEGAMKSIAAASGAAFAGMAGAIALATKAYAESREAAMKLDAVAGIKQINVDTIKAYAGELQKLTTFEDDATIAATATLASFGATESQLLRLMGPMQDLAAFMGGDAKQAALLLGKAMDGQGAALTRVGIALSDAQEEMLRTGTQAERVNMLVGVMQQKFGGLAAAMSGTATGAFTQLQNAAGDILEEFGAMVETPLIVAFRGIAEAARTVSGFMSGLSAETKLYLGVGTLVATAVAGIVAAMAGLGLALPALITGFTAAAGVMAPLVVMGAVLVAKLAAVALAVALVRKAWVDDLGGIKTFTLGFVNKIGKWWTDLVNNLVAEWHFFRDDFVDVLNGLARNPAIVGIVGALNEEWGEALLALNERGETASAAIERTWTDFTDSTGGAIDSLKKTAGVTADYIIDAFKGLAADLGLDFDALKKKFQDIFTIPPIKAPVVDAAGAAAIGGGGGGGDTADAPGLMDLFKTRVADAFASAGSDVANSMAMAAEMFAEKLQSVAPRIGAMMEGATQGFAVGGPIGALIGAIVAFLLSIQGVQDAFAVAERGLRPLVEILDMFFAAVGPFIDAFGKFGEAIADIGTAMSPIQPLLTVLGAALSVVSDALEWVAGAMEEAATWFKTAWEDAMFELGKLFRGWMDPIADELQKAKGVRDANASMAALTASIEANAAVIMAAQANLAETSKTVEDTEPPVWDLGEAAAAAATAINGVAASLLNVPAGFKLAAARFAAIGDTAGAPRFGGLAGAASGGSTISIGQVLLTTDDPRQFLDALESEAAWRNFATTGTPIGTPPAPGKR